MRGKNKESLPARPQLSSVKPCRMRCREKLIELGSEGQHRNRSVVPNLALTSPVWDSATQKVEWLLVEASTSYKLNKKSLQMMTCWALIVMFQTPLALAHSSISKPMLSKCSKTSPTNPIAREETKSLSARLTLNHRRQFYQPF